MISINVHSHNQEIKKIRYDQNDWNTTTDCNVSIHMSTLTSNAGGVSSSSHVSLHRHRCCLLISAQGEVSSYLWWVPPSLPPFFFFPSFFPLQDFMISTTWFVCVLTYIYVCICIYMSPVASSTHMWQKYSNRFCIVVLWHLNSQEAGNSQLFISGWWVDGCNLMRKCVCLSYHLDFLLRFLDLMWNSSAPTSAWGCCTWSLASLTLKGFNVPSLWQLHIEKY